MFIFILVQTYSEIECTYFFIYIFSKKEIKILIILKLFYETFFFADYKAYLIDFHWHLHLKNWYDKKKIDMLCNDSFVILSFKIKIQKIWNDLIINLIRLNLEKLFKIILKIELLLK